MESVKVEERPGTTRCPYCHDELVEGQRTVACVACGARHHSTCFRANRACATCGGARAGSPEGPAELETPRRETGLSLARKAAVVAVNLAAWAFILSLLVTGDHETNWFFAWIGTGLLASAVSGVAARSFVAAWTAPVLAAAVLFAFLPRVELAVFLPIACVIVGVQGAVGTVLTWLERTYNG